jgi:Rap1a immunity proteins
MRHILLIAAFLSLMPFSDRAQSVPGNNVTGNKLWAECTATETARQMFCTAYIIGASDVGGAESIGLPPRLVSCAPHGVANGELVEIVVTYLKRHPEERNGSAASLVLGAISKAYPCKAIAKN